MPQLLKSGSNVWKVGNNIFLYNRQSAFIGAKDVITQSLGGFNFSGFSYAIFPGVAVDKGKARIFVTNENANNISILDYNNPMSGIYATVAVQKASGIALDPSSGRIFVCNRTLNTITILDYNTLAVLSTLTNAHTGINNPCGIAIDTLGNRIFITSGSNSQCSIINYTTPTNGYYTILSSAILPIGYGFGLAVDRGNDRLFFCSRNDSKLYVLNYTDPVNGGTSYVNAGLSLPHAVILDVPNNRIYVLSENSSITVLDYSSLLLIGSISAASGMFSTCLNADLDPFGNRIFVANAGNNTVSILTNQFT